MNYLGIDTGAKGALAIIFEKDKHPAIWSMPTIKVKCGKKMKTRINLKELWALLRDIFILYSPVQATIESIHSLPGEGVSSAFSFGQRFGQIEALVLASEIEYSLVSPQKWKNKLGLLTKGDVDKKTKKGLSIKKCKEYYPNTNLIPEGCRVESDGWAEAILIAKYAKLISKENIK